MPYSMIVFAPPAPDDDKAAIERILDYGEDPSNEGKPLDARLHALIDELVQIYPRLESLPRNAGTSASGPKSHWN